MSAQNMLRGEAARLDDAITEYDSQIDIWERRIREVRRAREDALLERADLLAAATALDSVGFRTELTDDGHVTVYAEQSR